MNRVMTNQQQGEGTSFPLRTLADVSHSFSTVKCLGKKSDRKKCAALSGSFTLGQAQKHLGERDGETVK